MTETVIQVLGGYEMDKGRGIVRIDEKSMKTLDVNDGEIVELQAKRVSVARCKPLGDEEKYSNSLRIDGLIRDNIGAEIGDFITINKLDHVKTAQEIFLTPLEDDKIKDVFTIDGQYIANCLDGIPLVNGDNVSVPAKRKILFFNITKVLPSNIPLVVAKTTFINITG